MDPDYPNPKRNFWRVDESSITPKMLRRHFSDMAELFPSLPITWDRKPAPSSVPSPPLSSVMMEEDHQIKFTGPFSIESLLKKDHHRPQVRIGVQPAAQTALNANCFSDPFSTRTAITDSLTGLEQMNSQYNFYYMHRSVEETSWRKPAQMALSPELHHALLYSPHFPYNQTVLTKASCSPPITHLLR